MNMNVLITISIYLLLLLLLWWFNKYTLINMCIYIYIYIHIYIYIYTYIHFNTSQARSFGVRMASAITSIGLVFDARLGPVRQLRCLKIPPRSWGFFENQETFNWWWTTHVHRFCGLVETLVFWMGFSWGQVVHKHNWGELTTYWVGWTNK